MKKNLLLTAILIIMHFIMQAQVGQRALQFDGFDDYVMISPSTNYQIGTSDFTIEAWIRDYRDPAQGFTTEPIFCIGYSSDIYFAVQNGNLLLSVGDFNLHTLVPEWSFSLTDLRDSACHHVAAVRQGNQILFYRDGLFTVSGTLNGAESLSSNVEAMIGCNDLVMQGTIKEVKFYQGARTQAQIQYDMFSATASAGILGYWKCDESAAITVYDYAYGNDGTLGYPGGGPSTYPIRVDNCCAASCPSPSNRFVSNQTSTHVKFNWSAYDCATGYQVRYRPTGTTVWTKKFIDGNTGYKTIYSLTPNTQYSWQIRSKCSTNAAIWSPWSNTKYFTTPLRTAGSEEEMAEAINIYPNPSSGFVNIIMKSKVEKLVIYNSLGELIYSKSEPADMLLIEDLSPGLYLLQAEFLSGERRTMRFIIE
jgi:hypothetical protein